MNDHSGPTANTRSLIAAALGLGLLALGATGCDPDDGSDVIVPWAGANYDTTNAPNETGQTGNPTGGSPEGGGAAEDVESAWPDGGGAPAEPSEPGEEPADPRPGEPADPDPAPVEPGPVDPADPADPTDPEDPARPGEPEEPVDPEEPVEPVDPAPTPAGCIGVAPLGAVEVPLSGAPIECNTDPGCPAPNWKLEDFQPQSCGYEFNYGLAPFQGRPTLVALLAAWCGFCRAQLEGLETLRIKLLLSGVDVHIVVINDASESAQALQHEFVSRSATPLFQDLPEIGAWGQHGGGKDDFLLYDAEGTLIEYLPYSPALNLATEEGMALLESLLLDAAK